MSVYVARIIHRFQRGWEVNDIKSFSKKHKLVTVRLKHKENYRIILQNFHTRNQAKKLNKITNNPTKIVK